MRDTRIWHRIVEWALVLCATAAAFHWAKRAALAERGLEACGGEYLLWLIPLLYYVIKQFVSDLIEDFQALR